MRRNAGTMYVRGAMFMAVGMIVNTGFIDAATASDAHRFNPCCVGLAVTTAFWQEIFAFAFNQPPVP